jgi:hypothetical protein
MPDTGTFNAFLLLNQIINSPQVVCRGKLTAFWAGSDKLEWLQFEMEKHETYIQRAALESLFSQPSPSQLSQTQSPRMNKSTAKQRQQQQRLQQPDMQPMMKRSDLPTAEITEWGIPPELQSYLEVCNFYDWNSDLR